jgi:hypothetical protein
MRHLPRIPRALSRVPSSTRPFSSSEMLLATIAAQPVIFPRSPRLDTCTSPCFAPATVFSGNAEYISYPRISRDPINSDFGPEILIGCVVTPVVWPRTTYVTFADAPGKLERDMSSVRGRAETLNIASIGVPVSDAPGCC